jgi:hypothetical protein
VKYAFCPLLTKLEYLGQSVGRINRKFHLKKKTPEAKMFHADGQTNVDMKLSLVAAS